jgi:hypothetical protein
LRHGAYLIYLFCTVLELNAHCYRTGSVTNKSDFIVQKRGIHAGYYLVLILFKVDVSWTDLFELTASRRWHAQFSLLAFVQLAVNHSMATRLLI